MDANNTAASLEKPDDAGEGARGVVKRWMLELSLADETEKKWRKKAEAAITRYENEKSENGFNILWANIEVTQPNVYNSKPRPDVRQRFASKDKLGKSAAEVIERALSALIDAYDFDHVINMAIFDTLLPGRGVSRVKYVPYFNADESAVVDVETPCEHVQWDDFRRGPGKTWEQVPWIAYRHLLTRETLEKEFPEHAKDIPLSYTAQGADKTKADENPDVFKRACVWEILDKEKRETVFIAEGYDKSPVKIEPDKLKLRDFFDCPRPMMAIFKSSSLIPQVEFEMYKAQAKELDKVTMRINKLTEALKYRGVYDASIDELKRLQNLDDGEFIPTATSLIAMQAGGLEKAIWVQPTRDIAETLMQLYQARDQIKTTIYEIVGIADIMRGSSDPNETLGAQEMKAQTGSVRMRRRQQEAQRYVRDLLRLKAEIISEHYTAEQLAMMTGIKLPTGQEKAMAAQAAQMGDPKAMEIAQQPSWDEVMQLLKNDMMRRFNIDIETDSTIAADRKADRQDAVEVVEGIGGFVQNIGPAVQTGAVSMEAAKKILVAIIRKAKLGREVEEAIEADAMNDQQQQQKPDPEMMKMQAEMELKTKQHEADMQAAQAKAQVDGKALEAELMRKQAESDSLLKLKHDEANAAHMRDQAKMDAENALAEREMALKEREAELRHIEAMQKIEADAQVKMDAIRVQAEIDRELGMRKAELSARVAHEGNEIKAKSKKDKS